MDNSEIRVYLKAIDAGTELNDRELLALLLDGCDMYHSGYDAADNLIGRFGTISEICDVSSKELATVDGVGLEGARLLKACRAAVYSMLRSNSTDDKPRLYTQEELIDYLRPNFVGLDSEYCYIFLLNERYKLVHSELVGRGNFEEVPFNFRRIVKLIGRYDASKVIIAHNHKASVFPSEADTILTNKLYRILDDIDIELVDHVIFCENKYKSMRDSGYIQHIVKAETLKVFPK